jgi:beta-glucosidase
MDNDVRLLFPPGFQWGAATAAYQIEGSPTAGGKGESIWDRFSHTPGTIANGDTGDVACDHYRRWPEDLALMRELGLDAYRFSIAWPRVLPTGHGAVNEAGLDFYERLVDGLLEAGIAPYVTLYHWDLPQALQDAGGWANRATATAFADYAAAVARRLGDRVAGWTTHNEPWVVATLGHLWGTHAPGLRDLPATVRAGHHLLLSHGLAVPALRAASLAPIGITLNLTPVYPASDSSADQQAAAREDVFANRWFLDPIFRGAYPAEFLEFTRESPPPVQEGDLRIISVPLDFLGINNYTRSVIRAAPGEGLLGTVQVHPDGEYTAMDWEIYPDGLRMLLERVPRDYAPRAVYITENGAAFADELEPDGAVHDDRRRAYLAGYLAAAAQACAAGVPLKGYFVWSLLDNFEWAFGYSRRFGLFYVDFASGRRYWKDSAHWYRRLLAAQHDRARAAAVG